MITETQTSIVVLQLTDELLAQLQPFLAGLEFTAWTAGQRTLCLTMHGEVYAALVEHVGTALDYDVHWQSKRVRARRLRRARAPAGIDQWHSRTSQLPIFWHADPCQPRGGRVCVPPNSRSNLASMPGRPDTSVSGRL